MSKVSLMSYESDNRQTKKIWESAHDSLIEKMSWLENAGNI